MQDDATARLLQLSNTWMDASWIPSACVRARGLRELGMWAGWWRGGVRVTA